MKLVSFDVGIKNLAVCIIEWIDNPNSNNNLNIHYWDIINLVKSKKESEEINYICCSNGCTTKPKSFIEFNETKYCFCTRHLTKKDELLLNIIEPYTEINWTQEKNHSCDICAEQKISTKKNFFINKSKFKGKKLLFPLPNPEIVDV